MQKLYPVFRFWNPNTRDHFFTIEEEEVFTILKKHKDYKYEGVAFYAGKEQNAD